MVSHIISFSFIHRIVWNLHILSSLFLTRKYFIFRSKISCSKLYGQFAQKIYMCEFCIWRWFPPVTPIIYLHMRPKSLKIFNKFPQWEQKCEKIGKFKFAKLTRDQSRRHRQSNQGWQSLFFLLNKLLRKLGLKEFSFDYLMYLRSTNFILFDLWRGLRRWLIWVSRIKWSSLMRLVSIVLI